MRSLVQTAHAKGRTARIRFFGLENRGINDNMIWLCLGKHLQRDPRRPSL